MLIITFETKILQPKLRTEIDLRLKNEFHMIWLIKILLEEK